MTVASLPTATLQSTCGLGQHDPRTLSRQYPPFKCREICEEFILSQLCSGKSGKVVGLDHISSRLLKDSADIAAKPLLLIINTSLRTVQVATDWKSAWVIPLFKNGKADEMDNSMEFAGLSFASDTSRNMEQGQLTSAVFIDLLKVFDNVDHAILLDKLAKLQIEDTEHSWLLDYLLDRTQVAEFQGLTSTPQAISVGGLKVLSLGLCCSSCTSMTCPRWCLNTDVH